MLNQTILCVCDPQASIAFYRDVLSMTLLQRIDIVDMRFSLSFMAYLHEDERLLEDPVPRARLIFTRETTLKLTHNWGTEGRSDVSGAP